MNKFYQVYPIILLLSLTASAIDTSIVALRYAKEGCDDMCGTVKIPYPFGIGANCSVNKWYIVDCNSSTPYLSALNQLQVLSIDLANQVVTVNMPVKSDCSNTNSMDLGGSPFFYSITQNRFVSEGCGNALMMDHGSVLTGCSTTCRNGSVSDKNNCIGVSCCHTTIPHHLKSYNMNLTGLKSLGGDRACGSALLVDKNSYFEERFSIGGENSYVPVSLMWTLSYTENVNIGCCTFTSRVEVDVGNSSPVYSWSCQYDSSLAIEGNPYITDGCDYMYSKCDRCEDGGGHCLYNAVYDVDGLASKVSFICQEHKSFIGVILGVSISMSVLFLLATSYALYKLVNKMKETRRRKGFFKRNGGLLLKQQEQANPSLVDKTILFASRKLEKATDNFNENRILGRGGQGTVYKGMLVNGRIVAIKKSKIVDENQLEQFINELVILSQVNHRNVVKLLGCCLETDVPLLVSEYIPNGTLHDHLHNKNDELLDSLNMRLQITTEVATAVSYLHSSTSIPIFHRDIKTTNILLDEKYRAKVSDFGNSRFVSIDQTHLTTLIKGTFGYLDPEYFQSSQFTEKSDVYSFGVVLVELLTKERPISLTRLGENISLATHFMLAMEEGRVMSIFDATVKKEGTTDGLLALANLATRCLNINGKYRPTMKEVATELEIIRASHNLSNDETSIRHIIYEEESSMLAYGESSSTFPSFTHSRSL